MRKEILFVAVFATWSPYSNELYQKRHFTELAHVLIVRGDVKMAHQVLSQQRDLDGCRHISHGKGDLNSVLDCVSFLNREHKMKIWTRGRNSIVNDINLLCQRISNPKEDLHRILDRSLFEGKEWSVCRTALWKQVYLTVYANYKAEPAESIMLIRKAQTKLGANSPWCSKALELFQHAE